ncbi:hypothetical protein B0H12DRAFT_191812 [Mycena haematopus]|nr:hypothetical protein B0H12DRAFT_191812 [Mycena haematopus]
MVKLQNRLTVYHGGLHNSDRCRRVEDVQLTRGGQGRMCWWRGSRTRRAESQGNKQEMEKGDMDHGEGEMIDGRVVLYDQLYEALLLQETQKNNPNEDKDEDERRERIEIRFQPRDVESERPSARRLRIRPDAARPSSIPQRLHSIRSQGHPQDKMDGTNKSEETLTPTAAVSRTRAPAPVHARE